MQPSKLRRQIAWEAARLLYAQIETECYHAKMRAARRIQRGWIRNEDLPTDSEIRHQVSQMSRSQLGDRPELEESHEGVVELFATARRLQIYETLLLPLESVRQPVDRHPEGDALFHSLQVYSLALDQIPYDEEFLAAALLHDVGKAIDPLDHVAAGLSALRGAITLRTAWLIENHLMAHELRAGKLGVRARRRLQENENFDELQVLAECDREGRVPGAEVPELAEALDYLGELADACD